MDLRFGDGRTGASATASLRAGESVLSPTVASRLMTRVRRADTTLSPREVEVLRPVEAGLSNRGIAKQLFLSETTVKSHLVHIYAKLGVKSRTSAVATARQRGAL